jgi:hypothetical protein
MSQRSKLDMESMAIRDCPPAQRYGTKIVFRQGSPLVPGDLRLVAAHAARGTLIISDQSRSAADADAQAIRCGAGTSWAMGLRSEWGCGLSNTKEHPMHASWPVAASSEVL